MAEDKGKAGGEGPAVDEDRVASHPVPLAAVFKTRRGRRRKRPSDPDRSVAAARSRKKPSTPPPEVQAAAEPDVPAPFVVEAADHADAAWAAGIAVLDDTDEAPVGMVGPVADDLFATPPVLDVHEAIEPELDLTDPIFSTLENPALDVSEQDEIPPPLGGEEDQAFDLADEELEFIDDTVDMDGDPARDPTPPPAPEAPPMNTVGAMEETDDDLRPLLPRDADVAWARDAILALAAPDARRFRTPTQGAWFSELFGEEFLLSQPPRSQAAIEREVGFLLEHVRGRGDRLRFLDVGCGTGRHALALARAGHGVVGLDLSPTLLRAGADAARREGLEIEFNHGDMRDIDYLGEFDAAYLFDTTFGFFTDVENLMLLSAIRRSLRSRGTLVLDLVNRDYILQELPVRNWWEGEGCLIQEDIEFDHIASRLEVRRYLVFADGRERIHDVSIRVFSPHELKQMLVLAGFRVSSISGGVHTGGAFFGACSQRMLVVARCV